MLAVLVVLVILIVAAAALVARGGRHESYRTSQREREMHARLYALLAEVGECWRGAGIPFWAVGGTALGAVRHGGVIPWDDDVDLGVWRADLARARREVLARIPGARWRRGLRCDTIVAPGRGGRPAAQLDVFPMRTRGGRVEFANWLARRRWSREYFAPADVAQAHVVPFGPTTVPVANNPCEYLTRAFPGWEGEGRIVKHDGRWGGAGPERGVETLDPRAARSRCRTLARR